MGAVFHYLRNTYPMYTHFRLFLGLVFALIFLVLNRSLFKKTFDETRNFLAQCFKKADTYLFALFFMFGTVVGFFYVSSTLHRSELFYTPTIAGLSTPLDCGIFFGLVVVLSYALFRIGSSPLISSFFTLFILSSPLQLYILRSAPDRDFVRATWILAIISGTLALVRFGKSCEKGGWLSVVLGLALGFGSWSRKEIALFIVPVIFTILFLTPLKPQARWKSRFSALFVLLYFFLISSPRPIFDFNAQQASAGYMSSLDNSLGLTRPPYDMGYLHLDEYIDANNTFVTQSQSALSKRKSFNEIYLRTLPADFLTRIYASALRIITLPFRFQEAPTGLPDSKLNVFFSLRATAIKLLEPLALPLAITTVFTLFAVHLRFGILYLGWLSFLATLFTTQFWQRHHFYGEVISWWGLAWLVQCVFFPRKQKLNWNRIGGSAFGITFLLLTIWGFGSVLRPIQERNLKRLALDYESAARGPAEDLMLLKSTALKTASERKVNYGEYLGSAPEFRVAEFGGDRCPFSTLWPIIRYVPIEMSYLYRFDWSRTLRVDLDHNTKSARLYFPTWQGFQGIELPKSQERCLVSLKKIISPSSLSKPMTLILPFGDSPLYQELLDLNPNRFLWGTHPVQTDTMPLPESIAIHPISQSEVLFQAKEIKSQNNFWRFDGFPEQPKDTHMLVHQDRSKSQLAMRWFADVSPAQNDTDLLITFPRRQNKGDLLVVRGHLETGGITVGLMREGERAGSVNIFSNGHFTALFEAQEDGDFQLGIASNLSVYNLPELRFKITQAGWVHLPNHSLKAENTHGTP